MLLLCTKRSAGSRTRALLFHQSGTRNLLCIFIKFVLSLTCVCTTDRKSQQRGSQQLVVEIFDSTQSLFFTLHFFPLSYSDVLLQFIFSVMIDQADYLGTCFVDISVWNSLLSPFSFFFISFQFRCLGITAITGTPSRETQEKLQESPFLFAFSPFQIIFMIRKGEIRIIITRKDSEKAILEASTVPMSSVLELRLQYS